MPKKEPRMLYLEWCDASSKAGWFSNKEALDWGQTTNWVIKTTGFLVEETKEYIVIAMGYSDENAYCDQMFINLEKIPTTWIRKRKWLKL